MKKLAGKTTMTTQSAMPLHSLCAFNVGQRAVTRGSNHFVRRLRGVRKHVAFVPCGCNDA